MLDKLFDDAIIKVDEGFSVLNGCLVYSLVSRQLGVRAAYFLIEIITVILQLYSAKTLDKLFDYAIIKAEKEKVTVFTVSQSLIVL